MPRMTTDQPAQLTTSYQPQQSTSTLASSTPSEYLHSLPPSAQSEIEQQIMEQLTQYAVPIASFVREQNPDANDEELRRSYERCMRVYREQLEEQYAGWIQGQQGGN